MPSFQTTLDRCFICDLRLAVFEDYTSRWKEQVEPTPARQPMTSDEFGSQYKLLKQMKLKDGRSYTAEHIPSGRAVLIHLLDESEFGGLGGLNALIEQLQPRDRSRVLATMTVDRSLVIVTQFLPEFEGIGPWLQSQTSAGASPLSPSPPASPATPAMHGEFTRLFRSAEELPIQAPNEAPR